MSENLEKLSEWRRERLDALARQVGGRTALGRMLGHKTGSAVGQMISGLRPINEKTIAALEGLPEARGWFNGADAPPDAKLTEKLISHSDENNTAASLLLRLTGILESLTPTGRRAAALMISEAVTDPKLAPSIAATLDGLVGSATDVSEVTTEISGGKSVRATVLGMKQTPNARSKPSTNRRKTGN